MSTSSLLTIYLIVLAAYALAELSLSLLNSEFVRRHKNAIPEFFVTAIDSETYKRSAEYALLKARFGRVELIFSLILLLAVIFTGFFGYFDSLLKQVGLGTYWHGVLFLLLLSLLSSIVEAPLSLYRTFVIEEKFGFNKMTLKLWLIDFVKGFLLSAIILTPLLLAIFWFMDTAGDRWWLYVFGIVAAFQLLLMFIYPVWIAPIFNTFEPLQEGELKDRVFALSKQLGFPTKELQVMDGSKRSGHGNAYFAGFGKNKRIVFFDTLLETLSTDQVVAVLAHEIGHQKLGHIKKSIVLSLLGLLIALWAMSILMNYEAFYLAFGFEEKSNYAALVVFSFASAPLLFFLSPLFSILSRKHEYEADEFAVRAVEGSKDLEEGLLALSKKSLGNLTPHPWYSFFHYSHPTLYERITAMRKVDTDEEQTS